MHHRVAVTPEPACHFHPSFSNRSLSGSKGGRGWRGEEEGKMDGVGVEREEEDGREEKGRKEEREGRQGPREREADEERR